MRFKAFISYSHAVDGQLAPALQSSLHRFAKPWYRIRALNIFRDETSLSINPRLWPGIQEALRDSEYFVLLASPESALSVWVNREVEHWLETASADRILIVLTDGELIWDSENESLNREVTNVLPDTLVEVLNEEPLYLDLRWARKSEDLSLSNPRFRESIADLASTLHGVAKNDLIGVDVRENRKARRLAGGAIVGLSTLLLVAVVAAFIALQQTKEAVRRGEIAIARQLAAQSVIEGTRLPAQLPTSVTLAIESLKRHPSIEASQALRAGMQLLAIPTGQAIVHDREINDLAFSPDESALATTGAAGIVRLHDPATGNLQVKFNTGRELQVLAFSDDGRYIAAAGYELAWVWDLKDQHKKAQINHGGSVAALTFSPDSNSLAIAGWNHYSGAHYIQLWNPVGSRLSVPEMSHGDTITALVFSPSGEYLASSSRDHSAKIWEPNTGKLLGEVFHEKAVEGLVISPDNRFLATASWDATVGVWAVPAAKEIARLPHESVGALMALDVSPDSQFLASAHNNGFVRIWDVRTRKEVSRFKHGSQVNDIDFSPDGSRIVSAGFDGTARIWNLASQREVGRIIHEAPIITSAFSRSGRYIATAGGIIARVWQHGGNTVSTRAVGPLESSWGIALSSDGEKMVFSDLTGAELWSTRDESSIDFFPDGKMANAVFLDADGMIVVTGHRDRVHLWKVGQTSPILTVPLDFSVRALALSRDGMRIAIGGEDRVEVRRATDGTLLGLRAFDAEVNEVSFSFDGRLINVATGDWVGFGEGAGVFVWRVDDGIEVHAFKHQARVGAAKMSPNGRYLATGSHDNLVRVWQLDNPEIEPLHLTVEGPVMSLAFNPSSTSIAASDLGGAVRIWELPSGEEIARMSFTEVITALALDSQGRLTTASRNYRFAVWNLVVKEMIRDACERLTRPLSDEEWKRFLDEPPVEPTCTNGPSASIDIRLNSANSNFGITAQE